MAKISKYQPHIITSPGDLICRCCGRVIPVGDRCWSMRDRYEHTNCALYDNREDELSEMDAKIKVMEKLNNIQVRYQ